MVKELKDLATDKPEEIAAELEQRAKSREPVPTEDPTPKDEPENPAEAPETGEAPATEPAPSEKQEEPEETPLLKRLRAKGYDHTFKDEDALLDAFVNGRKRLSTRDEDAALGRALREAGVSPDQLSQLFTQEPAPAKGKDRSGPPKWNPEWDRHVKRVENDDGEVEYRGPPEMVKAVREYEAEMDSFRRAPVETMLDRWGLDKIIEQRAEQAVLRQQGTQTYQSYMKENGDFIEKNHDEIVALTRQGWGAMHAIEHLKLKQETETLRKERGGDDAKKRDLDRIKDKVTHRNGAAGTPIRSARDLANLDFKDAVNARLAESGESIPESW